MIGPVGIVGLGLVGAALARRLRERGVPVVGYDLDPAKARTLAAVGVVAADSPCAVGAACAQVVVAVFDTGQLEAVVEGADGILRAAPKPRTIVTVVTADPERIAALAARLAGHAIDLLEGPLSGSSVQIEQGDAVMFVGGSEPTVRLEKPLLDALCARWTHVGAAGMGARAKLVTNHVLGLNRAVLAEGLVFAEAVGLDRALALELLRHSNGYSRAIDVKGDRFLRDDYTQPEARLYQHAKDVALMLEQAAARGQRLPLATVHASLLAEAMAQGERELDNAAVINAIRRARIVKA